jgi:hypothetical protein
VIDPFGPLLAAHLVGDFIVQNDWMSANKGRPPDTHATYEPGDVVPAGRFGPLVEGCAVAVLPTRDVASRRTADSPSLRGYYEGMQGTLAAVRHPPSRKARWRSWGANQAHVATYHATLLPVLIALGASAGRIVLALAISWVLHSFIDRRWPVIALMRATASPEFAHTETGRLWVDQALHIATIAAMAAYVAR